MQETDSAHKASYAKLRRALANQAYASGTIRLVDGDLRGTECLVASRQGLFAVNRQGYRLVAYGLFFGLGFYAGHLYVFEAGDRPANASNMGRIIRFRYANDIISAPQIVCSGLDNGCHQLLCDENGLLVVDTYNQAIQNFTLEGAFVDTIAPLGKLAKRDSLGRDYVHINSISRIDGNIHLMLHNGPQTPICRSEILVMSEQWRVVKRYEIDGHGCHDIVPLDDGVMIFCGSAAGEIIGSDGTKVKLCDEMTRGLAANDTTVFVGTSKLADRESRQWVTGSVLFLDRHYQRLAAVELPAAPTCIVKL